MRTKLCVSLLHRHAPISAKDFRGAFLEGVELLATDANLVAEATELVGDGDAALAPRWSVRLHEGLSKIVSSLGEDVAMPLVGLLIGNVDFSQFAWV